MKVKLKGKKDDEAVHMDFGQMQAALQSGAYEIVEEEGERGPDVERGVWGEAPAEPETKDTKPKVKSGA